MTEDQNFSQEPSDEEIEAMEKKAMEKEEAREYEEFLATATAVEVLYSKSCMSCHGDAISGGGIDGPGGPDLSSIGSYMSAEEIEKVIIDGKGAMIGGLLSDEEAREVAEWLSEMN